VIFFASAHDGVVSGQTARREKKEMKTNLFTIALAAATMVPVFGAQSPATPAKPDANAGKPAATATTKKHHKKSAKKSTSSTTAKPAAGSTTAKPAGSSK
jgi:hypothetical protein